MHKNNNSPEQRFWHWFLVNEESLRKGSDATQAGKYEELEAELKKVNEHLGFEIERSDAHLREFVVSASGRKEAFPAVVALVEAAPKLEHWIVRAFRPRREIERLEMAGRVLHIDEVFFTMEPAAHLVNITLYFGDEEDFDEEVYGHIAFVLLDAELGEFDVEMLVGRVDVLPRNAPSRFAKYPLRELPKRFDEMVMRMSS